jgi:hypothetical protein
VWGLGTIALGYIVAACGSSGGGGGSAGDAAVGGTGGASGGSGGSTGGAAGTSGTGGAAEGGLTIQAACAASAEGICAKLEACSALVAFIYGSVAECEQSNALECEADLGVLDTTETVDTVSACTAARAAAGCEVIFDSPPACDLPPGPRADGEACEAGGQCSGGVCQFAEGAACGTCVTPANDGGSCANVPCASGLICGSANDQCYKPGELGDDCYQGQVCKTGLVCREGPETCQLPGQLGDACGPTRDSCDFYSGYSCNPAVDTCAAILVATAVGDSCGFDSSTGQMTRCSGEMFCSSNDFDIGLCNPRPAAGQACDVADDQCKAPGRCVSGTCSLPGAATCG